MITQWEVVEVKLNGKTNYLITACKLPLSHDDDIIHFKFGYASTIVSSNFVPLNIFNKIEDAGNNLLLISPETDEELFYWIEKFKKNTYEIDKRGDI